MGSWITGSQHSETLGRGRFWDQVGDVSFQLVGGKGLAVGDRIYFFSFFLPLFSWFSWLSIGFHVLQCFFPYFFLNKPKKLRRLYHHIYLSRGIKQTKVIIPEPIYQGNTCKKKNTWGLSLSACAENLEKNHFEEACTCWQQYYDITFWKDNKYNFLELTYRRK